MTDNGAEEPARTYTGHGVLLQSLDLESVHRIKKSKGIRLGSLSTRGEGNPKKGMGEAVLREGQKKGVGDVVSKEK